MFRFFSKMFSIYSRRFCTLKAMSFQNMLIDNARNVSCYNLILIFRYFLILEHIYIPVRKPVNFYFNVNSELFLV